MNKKIIIYFSTAWLCVFLLMGCDPPGTTQMNKLGDLLNDDNGPTMPISQLMDSINAYNEHIEGFNIHFPLTDTDERPFENTPYVNPVTGSKMVFSMSTDDVDFSIGSVVIEQKAVGEISLGNDTSMPSFTKYVQSRGKGVYALYEMWESSDSLTRRIWSRVLLYVYPGADSIMTTRGYAESKHMFYANHSRATLSNDQPDTPSQYEVQIKEEKPESAEGEMDAVRSVWLTNKRSGKVFRVCVTNPMAEAQWGKMNDEMADAVDVSLTQVAAADRAMIVPCDDVKIIVEGCPDGRNIWTYIIDPYTGTAKQLPSSEGVISFDSDKKEIIAASYGYDSDGRYSVKKAYSLEGKFLRIVGDRERE